jgi:exopolysaccharide biosynthesis polyprenyl glycosylphosphotransferase
MNDFLIKFRTTLVLFVDIVIGCFALCATLFVRYGGNEFNTQLSTHIMPFTVIGIVFFLSFYIFNLYSFRFNRNITEFTDSFTKSIIISFGTSILIFYIFGGFFELTPKTNLVIFTVLFGLIDFYLRVLIRRHYSKRKINRKIFIINSLHNNLVEEIKHNQNIGYEVIGESAVFNYEEILASNPDIVIVDSIGDQAFSKLYSLLKLDISIYTINMFYEETFQKIPTETIDKDNIIEYVNKNKTFFIFIKRFLDFAVSLLLLIIISPLWILIALAIKLTSKGPVLYKQTRVTINDTLFTIYKFRSMCVDSEKDGAVWTTDDKTDKRITPLGKVLRKTHLDEIPQLLNILCGDISFVGPRPERPEFTKMLNEKVEYYDLRHSVKPGLTGWAQINYRYGASVEDSKEKLKYDFYYIKNRNMFLDFLIVIKTVAMILQKH